MSKRAKREQVFQWPVSLDVLIHTLAMLSTCDVVRCARVCKTFWQATNAWQPWQRLSLPPTIQAKELQFFLRKAGSRLESLSMPGALLFDEAAKYVIEWLETCTSPSVTLRVGALGRPIEWFDAVFHRSPERRLCLVLDLPIGRQWFFGYLESSWPRMEVAQKAVQSWLTVVPSLTVGRKCRRRCEPCSYMESDPALLRVECSECNESLCIWRAAWHGPCGGGCNRCATVRHPCYKCNKFFSFCRECSRCEECRDK